MGLHLDWEIEAEQSKVRGHKEDRASARKRRLARLRLLLGIALVIAFLGALYGAFLWRLDRVDQQIRQALADTVEAEITTLRIADRNAFLSIQRSASETWIEEQARLFEAYQQLKSEQNVQLTGEIISLEVSGPRGRVQVSEIIDGIPYVRTWFYWRYAGDEGWRHVPPDYTFWGSLETIETDNNIVIRYRSLDEAVAEAAATALENWFTFTCQALPCGNLPATTVEILPDESLQPGWNTAAPWTLQIPSPYTGVARLDRPFDVTTQTQTAAIIADRLLTQASGSIEPTYPADAVFIRDSIKNWLIGQYTQLDTASYLINSYAQRHGEAAVGQVLQAMAPGSDIRVLLAPAGATSVHELAVDWRDYLTWRLNLEHELHQQRDELNFVSLYDMTQPETANLAFTRFNEASAYQPHTVLSIQQQQQPDGTPGLSAVVQVGEGETGRQETILFRLSDGVWKRAN